MKPKRPFSVTLLAILVLSLVAIHLTRFAQALQQWTFLNDLPLSVSPLYLAATGLFWGAAGVPVLAGLWRGGRSTPAAVKGYLVGYGLYYWLEQALVMASPLRQSNWPFTAGLTIVILIGSFLILSRPKARNFFGETNERKPENSAPERN